MKKVKLNFNYPLENSYFIEGDNLVIIKQNIDVLKEILLKNFFDQVQVPFLTSRETINKITTNYKSENLIQVYPGGDRNKILVFSPYMLFIQGLPLLRFGKYSYHDYPIRWFSIGPSYKKLSKSGSDPYNQLEEIYSIQGGIFFTNEIEYNQIDIEMNELFSKIYKTLNVDFSFNNEILFYNTESKIFRNTQDNRFLGGYHFEKISNLNENGIQIKDKNNKDLGLNLCSFSISQNSII